MKNIKKFESLFDEIPDVLVADDSTMKRIAERCQTLFNINETEIEWSEDAVVLYYGDYIQNGEKIETMLELWYDDPGEFRLECTVTSPFDRDRGNKIEWNQIVSEKDLYDKLVPAVEKYKEYYDKLSVKMYERDRLERRIREIDAACPAIVDEMLEATVTPETVTNRVE